MQLTIGQLAKSANTKMTTIRYYERRGLLDPLKRSPAGYRLYSEDAIAILNFIKNAQYLGFTLDEIHELIHLNADENDNHHAIIHKTEEKIRTVEDKITSLEKMKQALHKIVHECKEKYTSENSNRCPIIEMLNENISNLD